MQKKSSQFNKFTQKSNAARKEAFRQEKKQWKKEREEYFEKKRSLKSDVRSQRSEVGGQRSEVGGQRSEVGGQNSDVRHPTSDLMPLNKFIAHAGICARREAAELVRKGVVKVNGVVITEPGHKVSAKDEVKLNGKKIFPVKDRIYILINKPKDYLTTTDDPMQRKTVLDLVRRATNERVFPVGRLDRNTSGVLLLTNDGELAQQLTHPSHEIKKIYAVTLDKPLQKKDFDQILQGVTLEDGIAKADALAFTDKQDRSQVGMELHSGKNRIVRRIFESLGYDVKNLDRVSFAGLTKKNVERGKWRFLTEKEVRDLKYFSKGK